ncbi:DnaJ domain-containing protein [Desulfobacter vibrioformis]|uniref:DnaJ domain-containing protein n=1 Tax=Desulfobacter vibrioformis TaxID=34031 RepID=UPI00055481D2|nr:DnaJ domain-containing protein [Desulfobacter vibrioformis]
MTPLVKFILVLLGLAYLISPADAIPEMYLPWVGWIDDSLVILCLYHLIRYGRLPSFLFKKGTKQSFEKKNQDTETAKTFRKDAPNRSSSRSNPTGQSAQKNSFANTSTVKSPYEILGVDKSASWPKIQNAYKSKIKQYHPDKLSHLGEEFSNLANEKFLEIQQAYATLKSIYNR